MPRPTGIGVRHQILALSQAGLSQLDFAERVGVRRETVCRILVRRRETGRLDPGRSTGRPRISTERDDHQLQRWARQDRFKSCSALRTEWLQGNEIEAHRRTINGRLLQMGYRARCTVLKPKLMPRHNRNRLAWSRNLRNLTVAHWQDVAFADESRFMLFPADGRLRVRRRAGESLLDECVRPRVAAGGGSVHVWGAFSAHGKPDLVALRQNVTGAVYQGILEQQLLPWARQEFGNNFRCQDGNASVHRAWLGRNFLQEQEVNALQQPSLSPDINPIEHLWDELGRAIRRRSVQPTNIRQLEQALIQEWAAILQERLKQLAESMSRRLAAVIDSNGSHTHY